MTYRPLPIQVTIKPSTIEGLGLFAVENIKKSHEFGITHVWDEEFENNYIRTPLGAFFNHSEEPNCECYMDGRFLKLRALRDIEKDEEITVKYWLYEIK
jgi:SET domain-containing protein